MKNKMKSFISILIAAVLVISGTFAWVNFAQNADEFAGDPRPGDTLHDDYDPEPDENGKYKKEVYVENWGDAPLYVRIKLYEYMETGEGAGLKGTQDENGVWIPNPDNHAMPFDRLAYILYGRNINSPPNTWRSHTPDVGVEICYPALGIHEYWKWEMGGGSKIYMPAPEDKKTDSSYVDQNIEIYESLSDAVGLKETLLSEVITFEEWYLMGQPVGNYWVIDSDGWAYWAALLEPGEATGLLLTSVTKISEIDKPYYYAIYVMAQMATKTGEYNYTNFYDGSNRDNRA